MPSWNEKAHVIPTVNVNLATCDCSDTRRLHCRASASADGTCPTKPALIPCPIPPTFETTVRLGECNCNSGLRGSRGKLADCAPGCPARHIRVSCSISGKTWAESEVTDVIDADRNTDIGWSSDERAKMLAACRDRLALVKALVTGKRASPAHLALAATMFSQRDAVFAALAKAHRAEDALIEALGDYEEAKRGEPVVIYGLKRESHGALERYVERLIEQVGVVS